MRQTKVMFLWYQRCIKKTSVLKCNGECFLHYTAGTIIHCQIRLGINFSTVSQLQALSVFTFQSFAGQELRILFSKKTFVVLGEFNSEAHLIHLVKN